MKKGLLLFTGIIELIFFILVLILSIYNLAFQFLSSTIEGLIGAEIAGLLVDVFNTMYRPLVDLLPLELEAKLMAIILAGLMIVLSLVLVIFASKKLGFAKLDDFEFLQKRKALRWFFVFEFLVFAGAVGTMVYPIVTDGFEFVMLTTIPQGVSVFINLLIVFFSLIQIGKMRRAYKKTLNGGYGAGSYGQPTYPAPNQNYTQNTQQYGPQNGQGVYTQPQEPSHYQPNMIDATVDQGDLYAGYPDKIKADLERLDRLHANGALTEDSFQAMRTKILQGMDEGSATGTDANNPPPQV